MKHVLIITRDEVNVQILKPESLLYGSRYDYILIDEPKHRTPAAKEKFWRWIKISVRCRVKDFWEQVSFFT